MSNGSTAHRYDENVSTMKVGRIVTGNSGASVSGILTLSTAPVHTSFIRQSSASPLLLCEAAS